MELKGVGTVLSVSTYVSRCGGVHVCVVGRIKFCLFSFWLGPTETCGIWFYQRPFLSLPSKV